MVIAEAVAVSSFGGLVGTGELLSRYRSDPRALVSTPSAWLYVALNALAAWGALILIHSFGWTFGMQDRQSQQVMQVLVAGFSAVAFFRTSLFTARIGGSDVGIGPSTALIVFLETFDRSVDRIEARRRSRAVGTIMQNVSFERAHRTLPTYCLALLQNVSRHDQEVLAAEVAQLHNDGSMSDDLKALALGLELMNLVGPDVLSAAVDALGERISQGQLPPASRSPAEQKELSRTLEETAASSYL